MAALAHGTWRGWLTPPRTAVTVRRLWAGRRCLPSCSQRFVPGVCPSQVLSIRLMSQQKGFLQTIVDNVKEGMAKNKEMKENLKKFREEAKKLEESDTLKKARQKYDSIEAETVRSSTVVKKKFEEIQKKVGDTWDEAQKIDLIKRGKSITSDVAEKAASAAAKGSEQLSKTNVFKSVSEGVKAVKSELDDAALSRAKHYQPPAVLLKRSDLACMAPKEEKAVEADTSSTGVVMHKDSRWFQSWQSFKDNNPYMTRLFDLKMKYDESDNVVIRMTRAVTDKVTDILGGVFSKTEMSEVLTEIVKVDPSFDRERFIKFCQYEVIPNVLEALVRGELEILKDWCHEAAFNQLAHPVKQAATMGYKFSSRVLDVSNVDLVAGKMMEQGPVLIISFNSQQIMVVRNAKGQVAEGDPEKIMRFTYVWALCRDQENLDPKAAWKVMEISGSSSEQWL